MNSSQGSYQLSLSEDFASLRNDVKICTDLLEQLRAIEDIRQLKSRYFRFVDTHDWQGLVTIFCAEAIFTSGLDASAANTEHVARGKDAIVDYIREGMQWSRSVHHGHGHEVVIDSPDEAHGVIAMEDIVNWEKPPKAYVHGYGHYHEIYRVEDGAWRIWRSTLARLRVDTNLLPCRD